MADEATVLPPWEDVAEHFVSRYPSLDPDEMRATYQQAQQLHQARTEVSQQPENPLAQEAMFRSIPFASAGVMHASEVNADRARRRIAAGSPEEGDYHTLATHERNMEMINRGQGTWGGDIRRALLSAPAIAGEMMAGASLLGAPAAGIGTFGRGGTQIAAGMGGTLGRAALAAAPSSIARTVGQTAAAPSMWMPGWAEQNIAAGRQADDWRGLGQSFALGTLQTRVLGSMNAIAGSIERGGLTGIGARLGTAAVTGTVEQAAADVVGSALGLQTGYGVVGDVLRGEWGNAGRHATVNALTFAAFRAFHELEGPRQPMVEALTNVSDTLQALTRAGRKKTAASEALRDIQEQFGNAVHQADIAGQPLTRERAAEMANNVPEGPLRDHWNDLAEHLPEEGQPVQHMEPPQQAAQGPTPGLDYEAFDRHALSIATGSDRPYHAISQKKLHEAIDAAIPEAERAVHHANVDAVFAALPEAAAKRVYAHLGETNFYPDLKSLGEGLRNSLTDAEVKESIKHRQFNGAFTDHNGKIFLDGDPERPSSDFLGQNRRRNALEVLAHELGHALDGRSRKMQLSQGKEWRAAYEAEIADGKLSAYSKKNSDRPYRDYFTDLKEGFAEFSRMLYSGIIDPAKLAEAFPKSAEFFKKNGLWPEQNANRPANAPGSPVTAPEPGQGTRTFPTTPNVPPGKPVAPEGKPVIRPTERENHEQALNRLEKEHQLALERIHGKPPVRDATGNIQMPTSGTEALMRAAERDAKVGLHPERVQRAIAEHEAALADLKRITREMNRHRDALYQEGERVAGEEAGLYPEEEEKPGYTKSEKWNAANLKRSEEAKVAREEADTRRRAALEPLRARFQAGEHVDPREFFEAAGLTPVERHVLQERLVAGRTHPDIANDVEALGRTYTRARIQQIEKTALAKIGMDDGTIQKTVFQQNKMDNAIEKAAEGKTINMTDLMNDREQARATASATQVRDRKIQTQLDRITSRWMREKTRGTLTANKEKEYVKQLSELSDQLAGKTPETPEQPPELVEQTGAAEPGSAPPEHRGQTVEPPTEPPGQPMAGPAEAAPVAETGVADRPGGGGERPRESTGLAKLERGTALAKNPELQAAYIKAQELFRGQGETIDSPILAYVATISQYAKAHRGITVIYKRPETGQWHSLGVGELGKTIDEAKNYIRRTQSGDDPTTETAHIIHPDGHIEVVTRPAEADKWPATYDEGGYPKSHAQIEAEDKLRVGGEREGEPPRPTESVAGMMTFDPNHPTDRQEGEAIARKGLGEVERQKVMARTALAQAQKHFDNWVANAPTPQERTDRFLQFYDAAQHGKINTLPAELQPFAQTMRDGFDKRTTDVTTRHMVEANIEDYMTQLWKPRQGNNPPEQLAAMLRGRRPLAGKEGFRRERFYEDYRAGIDAGLEPVSWNPAELTMLAWHQIDKAVFAHDLVKYDPKHEGLQAQGLSLYVKLGKQAPDGWKTVDDKIARVFAPPSKVGGIGPNLIGKYYFPSEVADMINNHVSAGISGNPAIPPSVRKIAEVTRDIGNSLNQLQLGLSLFHGTETAMNATMSGLALGIQKMSRGDIVQGLKDVGLSATLAGTPIDYFRFGKKLAAEYRTPGSTDPITQRVLEEAMKGGPRIEMPAYMGGDQTAKFMQALRSVGKGELRQLPAAIYRGATAGLEWLSKPVMQYWVPMVKMGAYGRMVQYEMSKMEPGTPLTEQKIIHARNWDSIENRMGQLTYDNLFWNRTMKDALQLGIRSVGWNLGTLRELGGAVRDIGSVKDIGGKGISPRLAYAMALPMVTAVVGGLTQALLTGKGPGELKDYFAPKTGRNRPDGSEDRVQFPTYMRDVMTLANRADEFPFGTVSNAYRMAKSKVHPVWGVLDDFFNNSQYGGAAISSPYDSLLQRTQDHLMHLLSALNPLSMKQILEPGRKERDLTNIAAGFVGVTPAPQRLTQSWDEQRQREQMHRYQPSPQMQRLLNRR